MYINSVRLGLKLLQNIKNILFLDKSFKIGRILCGNFSKKVFIVKRCCLGIECMYIVYYCIRLLKNHFNPCQSDYLFLSFSFSFLSLPFSISLSLSYLSIYSLFLTYFLSNYFTFFLFLSCSFSLSLFS